MDKCKDLLEITTIDKPELIGCDLDQNHGGYHIHVFEIDSKNYVVKWATKSIKLELNEED